MRPSLRKELEGPPRNKIRTPEEYIPLKKCFMCLLCVSGHSERFLKPVKKLGLG